ncbi:MAG: aerotolerance regulator BatA [Elusimicrobia bacterium CG1_02_37_114]|nr:MAG: aerotolerance regulator BatA [Elusimicrobia bacterium CG1_02_37_114]PIV52506.1 MAG: aerotolerance regulator BatA [Elusimicrobia bacterium CG02_land_8_20_14_3_00_37_13]PIZ14289.1 MAG: aerotolerance regulator BatA [Elusimicrobia bacterium CG_4_10_14_0_8_um_filter_37_32]
MRFANPSYLLFLLIIPALVWYYLKFNKQESSRIKFSSIQIIKNIPSGERIKFRYVLKILRFVCLTLLILALARPQAGQKGEDILTKGIDIMLCLDTSTSMRAEDFKPHNRLYAAKQAAEGFVKNRKNDRIGVVVFSALSFTQCPLTLDYGAVLDFLDSVEIGMTQTDGTAIGTAIATCVNRLKDVPAKSKVIILLTDGRNNMGEIDPWTAAQAAGAMDIKIYAIGAGVPGGAMYPIDDPVFGKRYVKLPEDLDEETLIKIASLTGGQYFRAKSSEGLREIYNKIDKMEKTEIKINEYTKYTELFPYFILPAVLLFFTEVILTNTYFRKVP